ncbi:S-adenosyl-L-methionine-dependent methyltransferase [Globomyces pollinis-pini]|nr:S-adenosyl-L-methionine-dependent methyltransferase [Globomyces pollinis-pini]KAJ3000061.1 hypothetical protein HDV02_000709 [Globomyces sp. JEL0801]
MPEYPADLYKQYRPSYPQELYSIVYKAVTDHSSFNLATDVGTGTGQTAIELAKKFKNVVGTDISANMLNEAVVADNVSYKLATAEDFSKHFDPESVDLITVSTAAHWFNMEKFYQESYKVLKPNGIVAIWGYGNFVAPDYPDITKLHQEYSVDFLEPYWDSGRHHLENLYLDQSFTKAPHFEIERSIYPDVPDVLKMTRQPLLKKKMSLNDIKGYLHTWSAYKTFKEKRPNDIDPVDTFCSQMLSIIGTKRMETEIDIYWPIGMIMARKIA